MDVPDDLHLGLRVPVFRSCLPHSQVLGDGVACPAALSQLIPSPLSQGALGAHQHSALALELPPSYFPKLSPATHCQLCAPEWHSHILHVISVSCQCLLLNSALPFLRGGSELSPPGSQLQHCCLPQALQCDPRATLGPAAVLHLPAMTGAL